MVESLHTNVNVSGTTNPEWFMKLLRPQEKWLFDTIGKSSCFLFLYAFFGYEEKRKKKAPAPYLNDC